MIGTREVPQGGDRISIPEQVRQRFQQISEGVYPQDIVGELKQARYTPVIIGYDHPSNLSDLPAIKKRFELAKQVQPATKLRVALEIIPPVQLQYIKDFLLLEEEHKRTGRIHGEIPRQTPDQYSARLLRNHAEHLALWLLDNNFDVMPIEHEDAQQWIAEDSRYFPEEETFFGTSQPISRQFLTGIRRDIHSLDVMQREKPDIVSVGTPHALKFDLLLDRDSSQSFYVLQQPIDWNRIINEWESAHDLYRSLNRQG